MTESSRSGAIDSSFRMYRGERAQPLRLLVVEAEPAAAERGIVQLLRSTIAVALDSETLARRLQLVEVDPTAPAGMRDSTPPEFPVTGKAEEPWRSRQPGKTQPGKRLRLDILRGCNDDR